MMTPDRETPSSRLSPADGEVLDELLAGMAAGGDISAQPIAATERGRRVSQWLGLISEMPGEEVADDLVARTMARIAVAAACPTQAEGAAGDSARTSAAVHTDFDVLDELLEATARGDMAGARTVAHTERGRRVSHWLDLIDHLPSEPPAEDLVARTMSRIAVRSRREAVIARISDHRPAAYEAAGDLSTGTGGSVPAIAFRWSELIGVAAVLMIAVSLLWPIMARTRSDAMRIACAANLSTAGVGMNNYALDNNRILPRYPTIAGSIWWNVGQPISEGVVQSNSAHLYKLRREGYTAAATLNCPTNGEAPQQLAVSAFDWPNSRAISYSYQNQYTPEPTRLSRTNSVVVLADKNPLFTPTNDAASSLTFNADHGLETPGNRHAQPGQNVLIIDGTVRWAESNAINGDNFYTVQNIKTYRGTETPSMHGDSFVVP